MPYEAICSSSRVQFIKKKFECSLSEENNPGSLIRKNVVTATKPNLTYELRVLNSDDKIGNPKLEINNVNKNEGKALVKRTPAFRREKLGSTKTIITQVPCQKSSTFIKLRRENLNDNGRKAILNKTKISDINIKDFKRSKTDTNLLEYCSKTIIQKKIFLENSRISNISNSLAFSLNKNNENDSNKKTNNQYSSIKKKENSDTDKNEGINLRFSESIRKALQSPLPKGPPPKKPPRTFCHASSSAQTSSHNASINSSSTPKKFDIPVLKSKLEKLEKVTRIHETGDLTVKTIDDCNKKEDKVSLIPNVIETCQSCLPVSQCFSHNSEVSNCKKVSKSKSEFYIRIDKADFNSLGYEKNKNCFGSASDESLSSVRSFEAIYDLPCHNKKNSFETFGKCNKELKDSVKQKKVEDLHYMCTDIINQTSKRPNFLSHIDSRKGVQKKGLACLEDLKSDFLSSSPIEDCNLIDTYEGNQVIEYVHDLKTKNEGERIDKQTCATSEKNSGDYDEKKKENVDEGENLSYVTAKRKIYVSKVSSALISQITSWKNKNKNKNSYKHLFECCLLVGLTLCESKQSVPYIKSVFPPNTKPPPLIESLCFPDAFYWPHISENHQPEEQCYSLVVTNENGERKYGYCRRVLPEGGHVCLPLAYCIISPHKAGGFFYKVLEELESKHGSPIVDDFIKHLYESEFPGPGERLKLKAILEEAAKKSQLNSDVYLSFTSIRRPPDVRLEEKDLTQLFKHLQVSVFLKVFSSLLHERKVLLLSISLRNLSSCINALESVLFPFSWQHSYIPVLPVHLSEMCEAPTPYVIGLLKPRNVDKFLTNVNFEDGILVDLDDSEILKCCGDEGSILPSELIRDLKTSLNLALNSSDLLSESVRSVLISDAFISFFVQVCGNYSKFIQSFPSREKIFQKEEFIKSVTSDTLRSFLDWFTETAMFKSFIQERLQEKEEDMSAKLFRRRAMEYSEQRVKDLEAVSLKNYTIINRKVKTLSDKIKDFTFAK